MPIRVKRSERRNILLLVLAPLLWACGEDTSRPYLQFAGGGFVFNYRTANHYYGFVVRQQRPLPEGARLKVTFEVPGSKTETQEEPAVPGRLQYKFQTGDLEGIESGHPYTATLVVLDKTGKEIGRLEKSFKTEVDQSKLPDRPLVEGPAYQQAPQ
jgi:hypothetical protein